MPMRILVVNRVDDPACVNAMEMIPGAEVRVVDEKNRDACAEALNEFVPQVVMVWGLPEQEYSAGVMLDKRIGRMVYLPPPISFEGATFCLFKGHHLYRLHIFPSVTDFNDLAVQVVEGCVPEVSVLITDPDEFWQKHLEKDFSKIPGVMVSVDNRFEHLGDAMRKFIPDIVVMNWQGFFPINSIRRYAKDPSGLKIAVFSDAPAGDIIRQGPDVDFVLCKTAPIDALTLVVKGWTEQIQARKQDELREGLLRNQRQAIRSS